MYSVSNAYLAAIKQPIQVHKVRGTIGSVAFTDENILDGSFSISNQSTDTSDIVLGSCYIGQLSATFTGLNISRTEWMNKVITPYFQLWFDDQNYEEVPLGVYTIKEVNHTAEGVEVVAYDNMYKFDKKFKKSGLNMVAKPYNFLIVFCQKCGIELGMNSTQVEALPNGNADLYLCGVRKSTTTYANDIETYRDALFWLAQCLGSFATMRRDGKLVLRAYKDTVDDSISDTYRLSGAKFADYITSYTGIYTESLYDGEVTYYGYDLATLQQMRDTAMQQLEQIITDLAELEEEYAQGQITEEEYKAQKKLLTSEKKAKEKYISWLDKMIAQAQSEGDGAYMDLGANPFFQRRDANIPSIADATLATTLRSHILSALGKIEYTPFTCSSVFGVHYDLGDVIEFNGGHADDDHGCIMSYEWTLHGQYNMEGYGIDPDKQNVKDVKKKQSDRAQKNALKATKNTTGTDTPVSSNNGDMHVDISENSESSSIGVGAGMTLDSSSGDANSGYNATAHCRDDTQWEAIYFQFNGLEVGGTYTMSAYVQIEGDLVNWNSHNFCITCATSNGVTEGLVPNRPDGQVTVLDNGFGITLFYDNQKHYYEGTFTAQASTYYVTVDIAYLMNTWASPPRTYPTHVTECKISEGEAPSDGDPKSVKVYVNGEWKTLKYVNKIKQVQTSTGGTKIATANNSDGTSTDIYAKKVEANPSGSGTANLETIQIGDTVYDLSEITPNPSDTATANLEKVDIKGTVYAIKDSDAIHSADKGANNGVASLDSNGKVPSAQLPTYPTVNNSTINIKKNGTTVGSFTLNQSSVGNINITVPTKTSDLTNDSGFITSYTDEKITAEEKNPTSEKTYNIPFTDGTTNQKPFINDGIKFRTLQGTSGSSGIAHLILGNDIASGTAGNKHGNLRIYSRSQYFMNVIPVNNLTANRTFTLPDKSGTAATTDDIPTVNNSTITIKKNGTTVDSFTLNQSSGKDIDISVPTKTSDLTNDSGFITSYTDEKVTAETTNPTSSTEYNILWVNGTSNQKPKINNGVKYISLEGTASAAGYGMLRLGNSTSTGTAANKYGGLRIYSEKNGYVNLYATAASTTARTIRLPDKAGTLAITTDTMTPASHTHGNIQNGGTLQTSDVAIASGDKLVICDSSDSNKIARSSLAFTSNTSKFLREDGTWQTVSVSWSGGSVTNNIYPNTDAGASLGTTNNRFSSLYSIYARLGKASNTNGGIYFYRNDSPYYTLIYPPNGTQTNDQLLYLPSNGGTLITKDSCKVGKLLNYLCSALNTDYTVNLSEAYTNYDLIVMTSYQHTGGVSTTGRVAGAACIVPTALAYASNTAYTHQVQNFGAVYFPSTTTVKVRCTTNVAYGILIFGIKFGSTPSSW